MQQIIDRMKELQEIEKEVNDAIFKEMKELQAEAETITHEQEIRYEMAKKAAGVDRYN